MPVMLLAVVACSQGAAEETPDTASPPEQPDTRAPTAVHEDAPGRPTFDVADFERTIGFGFFGGSGPDPDIPNYGQLLARDAIRPIYEPEFVAADAAGLSDSALVIGLQVGDDARAYPVGILRFREIVNDEVGGTPVLVTW